MKSLNLMSYLDKCKKPWKFLAPMVGNSEKHYRKLARRHGADLCYTEMVNCKVYNKCKCKPTKNQWYSTDDEDRPLVVQICGDNPEEMAITCKNIEKHCDAIDINFGCPQEIAKKGHYGSFLQDEWDLVEKIVKTCAESIQIPLFCKIRVFDSIEKSVEYAKIFERAGAKLLAVHGRTREQKGANTGLASWDHIKAIKNALTIPVVANGNLLYYEDIQTCYEYTNVDGVMSAEPHLFNPCIFCANPKNSIELFDEFLEIIKNDLQDVEYGSLKSHTFKIFSSVFSKYPELRAKVDKIKGIDEYFEFSDFIKEQISIGKLSKEDLLMKPYIREPKDIQNPKGNCQS